MTIQHHLLELETDASIGIYNVTPDIQAFLDRTGIQTDAMDSGIGGIELHKPGLHAKILMS